GLWRRESKGVVIVLYSREDIAALVDLNRSNERVEIGSECLLSAQVEHISIRRNSVCQAEIWGCGYTCHRGRNRIRSAGCSISRKDGRCGHAVCIGCLGLCSCAIHECPAGSGRWSGE